MPVRLKLPLAVRFLNDPTQALWLLPIGTWVANVDQGWPSRGLSVWDPNQQTWWECRSKPGSQVMIEIEDIRVPA